MTVELICPHCHFSKKLPEKKIPATAKWAVCPRCKQKFSIPLAPPPVDYPASPNDDDVTLTEGSPGPASSENSNPWENTERVNVFKRIFLTVGETLFHPAHFFGKTKFSGGYKDALAFGLLIGGLGDMLTFFWPLLLLMAGLVPLGDGAMGNINGLWIFLTLMVLIPLGALLGMFFSSCLLHVMLLILRGANGGFEGTFRVVAYSQSALCWSLIPFLGNWIGTVWKLVIQIIGLKKTHHVGYVRVIIAFLLPFIILFSIILLTLGPLLMVILK